MSRPPLSSGNGWALVALTSACKDSRGVVQDFWQNLWQKHASRLAWAQGSDEGIARYNAVQEALQSFSLQSISLLLNARSSVALPIKISGIEEMLLSLGSCLASVLTRFSSEYRHLPANLPEVMIWGRHFSLHANHSDATASYE